MASHTANITAAALLLTSSALAWATNDFVADTLAQDPSKGQQEATKQRADNANPHYVSVETIEGSDCRLQPPADDAGEKDEAEIKDVLIDSRSGEMRWAILSSNGREVLVPLSALRWDMQDKRFVANHTEADLKRLPEFDLDDAGKRGFDEAVDVAAKGWHDVSKDGHPETVDKRPQEASAAKTFEGTSYYAIPSAFYRISQLDELELYGTTEEIGAITKSIVNCNDKKVEFLVVNKGGVLGVAGEKYLLPFESVRICKDKSNEDAEPRLYSNMTTQQLEASVRYDEPKEGVLDAAAAERARSMHKKGS